MVTRLVDNWKDLQRELVNDPLRYEVTEGRYHSEVKVFWTGVRRPRVYRDAIFQREGLDHLDEALHLGAADLQLRDHLLVRF